MLPTVWRQLTTLGTNSVAMRSSREKDWRIARRTARTSTWRKRAQSVQVRMPSVKSQKPQPPHSSSSSHGRCSSHGHSEPGGTGKYEYFSR